VNLELMVHDFLQPTHEWANFCGTYTSFKYLLEKCESINPHNKIKSIFPNDKSLQKMLYAYLQALDSF